MIHLNTLLLPDVDECTGAIHKCDVNAECINTHGSYNCTCKPGYTGDGINCTGEMIQIYQRKMCLMELY